MQKIFVEVTGVAAQQCSQVCVCFFFLGIWPTPSPQMGTKKEGAVRRPLGWKGSRENSPRALPRPSFKGFRW